MREPFDQSTSVAAGRVCAFERPSSRSPVAARQFALSSSRGQTFWRSARGTLLHQRNKAESQTAPSPHESCPGSHRDVCSALGVADVPSSSQKDLHRLLSVWVRGLEEPPKRSLQEERRGDAFLKDLHGQSRAEKSNC